MYIYVLATSILTLMSFIVMSILSVKALNLKLVKVWVSLALIRLKSTEVSWAKSLKNSAYMTVSHDHMSVYFAAKVPQPWLYSSISVQASPFPEQSLQSPLTPIHPLSVPHSLPSTCPDTFVVAQVHLYMCNVPFVIM